MFGFGGKAVTLDAGGSQIGHGEPARTRRVLRATRTGPSAPSRTRRAVSQARYATVLRDRLTMRTKPVLADLVSRGRSRRPGRPSPRTARRWERRELVIEAAGRWGSTCACARWLRSERRSPRRRASDRPRPNRRRARSARGRRRRCPSPTCGRAWGRRRNARRAHARFPVSRSTVHAERARRTASFAPPSGASWREIADVVVKGRAGCVRRRRESAPLAESAPSCCGGD